MKNRHREREQYVLDHMDEECDRRIALMTKDEILETIIYTDTVVMSIRNWLRESMYEKVQEYLADEYYAQFEAAKETKLP